METTHTISVDKTGTDLLGVFQEKIESNLEKGSNMKSEILDPKDFIGKTENEVFNAIKDHYVFRIVERDGKSFEITADHLPFRWNLYISNGIVSNIRLF